ncbi:MAG TPA: hypothetical protein VE258_18365 [Ktedonobacterales bacterium]|nr:hypothetical protein [Ktedonobacterales bacterium]
MTTFAGAEVARGSERTARLLRRWLLVVIGIDLGLLAVRAATYPTFFSMPGAASYLIAPVVALAIYAAVICALPLLAARAPGAATALRVGTLVGLVGGAIDVVNITLESLLSLPQAVVTVTTGVAMLGLFLSFGVAGFLGGRRAGSFGLGLGAAVWSAVVAILLAVTFGFVLINVALPKLAHDEIGDPDYARSGWTDVRAFAIANTFDAGLTHLVEAPIIAAVLGAAGSGLAGLGARRRQPKEADGL